MAKKKADPEKAKHRSDGRTIFWPVVSIAEVTPELTGADFRALESAGNFSLTPASRRALANIAEGWIAHDRTLHSPRVAQFRSRLKSIIVSLEHAHAESDLNGFGATTFDRHLFHWLIESGLPGMDAALAQIGSLSNAIAFFKRAEQLLPPDSGSARPMNEDRFLRYLADEFERCGGKVSAYRSHHSNEGYAKTPFRQFVQKFYRLLPLKSRRTRRGLDVILTKVVMKRRRLRQA